MDCGCPQKKGQRQKNLWPKYFTEIFVLDSDGVLTNVLWKISKFCFKFCVLEDQKWALWAHSLPPSLGASEICGLEALPHSLHCLAGRFWILIVEGTQGKVSSLIRISCKQKLEWCQKLQWLTVVVCACWYNRGLSSIASIFAQQMPLNSVRRVHLPLELIFIEISGKWCRVFRVQIWWWSASD